MCCGDSSESSHIRILLYFAVSYGKHMVHSGVLFVCQVSEKNEMISEVSWCCPVASESMVAH